MHVASVAVTKLAKVCQLVVRPYRISGPRSQEKSRQVQGRRLLTIFLRQVGSTISSLACEFLAVLPDAITRGLLELLAHELVGVRPDVPSRDRT